MSVQILLLCAWETNMFAFCLKVENTVILFCLDVLENYKVLQNGSFEVQIVNSTNCPKARRKELPK